SIYRMSTDIFPQIDIPVVTVVWQYNGMPADEIETRIVFINERVLTASVNGIEHIESQSLSGVGVIRIYFQPGASVAEAEPQEALYARGLSPADVSTAITNQNLIIPAGTAKIGATEYNARLNSSPDVIGAFNFIPVKTVNGVPVYVKDVAHVADGFAVQTNIV